MNETLFSGSLGQRLRFSVLAAVVCLTAFLAFAAIGELLGLRHAGDGATQNTIVISGEGEAYAVPDLGSFTYSVVSDKPTVAAAQEDATTKANAISAYLKGAGIDEKDIKTVDYSISPRYEYQSAACPSVSANSGSPVYCPGGRQVLIGYEVRQSNSVKVRDTAKAGELLSGVGSKGATEVSGLSFTVDDPTLIEAQARDKAIADAKTKAEALAKALGVHLVRIVSFSESRGGYPTPMYLQATAKDVGMGASAPEISVGQNKITSNVSVTYEIR